MTTPPFGSLLTAMVTPMTSDGAIDRVGLANVVEHLLATGHDGIVVNGTTGESPTLTTEESVEAVRLVAEQVGDRGHVIGGAGSNDTAHAIDLAREMAAVGATGLLVVTPYYNKPPQRGLLAHIVAVKDAKADLFAATRVMAATDLAWYSGDDVLVLPHIAQGAVGLVGVTTHLAGQHYRALIDAALAGNRDEAIRLNQALAPIADAVMNTSQGAIMAKAGLVELGVIEHATVRLPLIEGTPEHLDKLRAALATVAAI